MSTLYRGEQGPLTADAFAPTFAGDLGVDIAPGSLVINGTQQGDDQGAYIVQTVGTTVISLADTGGTRTDWIIARVYDEDYGDFQSTAVIEVISDVGGVNAATLPANSYLVAAVSFVDGQPLTADSVVDRRGAVVHAGPGTTDARGVVASLEYDRENAIEPLQQPGTEVTLGETSFQVVPGRSYTFSLYTGRWPEGQRRRFVLDLTWSQGNDRPREFFPLIQNADEYDTASVIIPGLGGRVDVRMNVLYIDTGQKAIGPPLRLTVREDY